MVAVTEGTLSTGQPYLRLGHGPPLVLAPGLTPDHENPGGAFRRQIVSWSAPFAAHFTVYRVARRPGLQPGTTMADIAADYAAAIENDIGGPVLLHGTSTGGSVALQLATDRPDLVRRLVVAAAASRLPDQTRRLMVDVASLVEDGDLRRASALLMGATATRRTAWAVRGAGWVLGPHLAKGGWSDMLATIAAEDEFDAGPRLHRVQAPALVLGSSADGFYPAEMFRETAAALPHGRAVVLEGQSHGYVGGSKVAAAIALGFLLG